MKRIFKFTDRKTNRVTYYMETGIFVRSHGSKYQPINEAGKNLGRATYLAANITDYGTWVEVKYNAEGNLIATI